MGWEYGVGPSPIAVVLLSELSPASIVPRVLIASYLYRISVLSIVFPLPCRNAVVPERHISDVIVSNFCLPGISAFQCSRGKMC